MALGISECGSKDGRKESRQSRWGRRKIGEARDRDEEGFIKSPVFSPRRRERQTIVGTPDQYQFLQSGFLGSGVMFSGKFVTSSCNAPASRSN